MLAVRSTGLPMARLRRVPFLPAPPPTIATVRAGSLQPKRTMKRSRSTPSRYRQSSLTTMKRLCCRTTWIPASYRSTCPRRSTQSYRALAIRKFFCRFYFVLSFHLVTVSHCYRTPHNIVTYKLTRAHSDLYTFAIWARKFEQYASAGANPAGLFSALVLIVSAAAMGGLAKNLWQC